jgi:ATP-dependent exoDNAse (exonuclease V) beta subunit
LLVISRWTGQRGTPSWGVLNNFLSDVRELHVPKLAAAHQSELLDCSIKAQADANAARVAAHDRTVQPSWSITSVTAEARHIAHMTRAADAATDDPTKVVATDTPTHRADAGLAWGTLIHGLLEHAMRHQGSTRADLRRLAMWLTVEQPNLRLSLDEALDTVEALTRQDFWSIAKLAHHSVETPFTVTESRSALTSGVIDLLHESADGWTVVDYKTDASFDRSASAAYEAQLALYRQALERCGLRVSSTDLRAMPRLQILS